VGVVVPAYRESLTDDQRIALVHLERFLGGYDRYLVLPKRLDLRLAGFRPMHFHERFFSSTDAYSALLLSPNFYRAFSRYEYILVYQLDSLVFADELSGWCNRGFDYVGAPWLHAEWVKRLAGSTIATGNGGFSLRNVESFLRVLSSRRYWLDPNDYWQMHWAGRSPLVRTVNVPRRYLKRLRFFNGVRWETRRWLRGTNTSRSYGTNEDVFWSFQAQHYAPNFRIAPPEEALRFAFERYPRECFELAGRQLPFGCHAWPRYDRTFWEPYILGQ
jgi:hypothetical protein